MYTKNELDNFISTSTPNHLSAGLHIDSAIMSRGVGAYNQCAATATFFTGHKAVFGIP